MSHASPRTARWLVLSAATLACVGTFNGHSFGWAFLLPPSARSSRSAQPPSPSALFGIAHERFGSFDAVTTPLLALLAVAAAVLAAARPPRSLQTEP